MSALESGGTASSWQPGQSRVSFIDKDGLNEKGHQSLHLGFIQAFSPARSVCAAKRYLSQAPLPGTPHTQTGTACLPHKGLRCSHGSLPTPEAAPSPPRGPRCPSCPRVERSFMKRPSMGMGGGTCKERQSSHTFLTHATGDKAFPQTFPWVDRSPREDANGLLPPPWWSPP